MLLHILYVKTLREKVHLENLWFHVSHFNTKKTGFQRLEIEQPTPTYEHGTFHQRHKKLYLNCPRSPRSARNEIQSQTQGHG